MISTIVSRLSAAVLLLGGIVLLFAADAILPAVIRGFPPSAAWLGQLLAGAWLGLGAANWLSRTSVLGGIYGRPIVMGNTALYLVSALSLLRALLLRGPFDKLRGSEAGKG